MANFSMTFKLRSFNWMNVRNIATFGLLALFAINFSCKDSKVDSSATKRTDFQITGQVNGFADSTWLFLQGDAGRIKDSAMVMQGQFTMTGKIPDSLKTAHFVLTTKNHSDYKFLWLENSDIKFNAEKGNFRNAVVTGSETQVDADTYSKIMTALDLESDSLNKIGSDQNISEKKRTELRDLQAALDGRRRDGSFSFIRNHPHSIVSANILDVYASTWGKDNTQELYDLLLPEMKNTSYGRNVNRYLTLNRNLKVGDQFVDFEQVNHQGQKIKLSAFKGKVILLEFWAAWCGPCRRENPELVKTYKEFREKGFEILGVSLDENKEHWTQAITTDELIWENVSELNGAKNSAALIYGIFGIPDNFLIDRSGKIIARNLRGEDLKKKLGEVLN